MTVIVYHQGVANLLDVEAGTLGAEWPDASLDVMSVVRTFGTAAGLD
jgi:hypothetical protein